MQDLLKELNLYSPAIQSVTTILMVMVTVYFAYLTHKTVSAMGKQRKDNMLPVIIVNNFNLHAPIKRQETYCIGVNLKNIGNGPAFGIMINFYDTETKEFIARSAHNIDYLEKDLSSHTAIHIHKKDFDSIKYRQNEDGEMESVFTCVLSFHNFYGEEHLVKQRFVLNKDSGEISPVVGTFKFVPNPN